MCSWHATVISFSGGRIWKSGLHHETTLHMMFLRKQISPEQAVSHESCMAILFALTFFFGLKHIDPQAVSRITAGSIRRLIAIPVIQ